MHTLKKSAAARSTAKLLSIFLAALRGLIVTDGDFIQAKKAKVEPKSLSTRYRYASLTGLVHVLTVVSRSQADSFALGEAGSFASRC